MSLRSQLLATLLVQGSGAAAMLAAVLTLGAALGPEPQARFSQAKALVEFGGALAMFGLPQALFYFVKSGRLGLPAARRLTWQAAVVAALVGAAVAWAGWPGATLSLVAVLAAAVAAFALHGQWRALALLAPQTRGFNIATALPQWLLLAAAVLIAGLGGARDAGFALAFVLAYMAGCAWAARALRPVASAPAAAGGPVLGALASYGLAAWLMASLATLAVLLAQQAASRLGGLAALGLFSMALALAQVPLTPLNYAAPLLLRRRMERAGGGFAWQASGLLGAGFGLLALAAAGIGLAWRSDLGLDGYPGLHAVLAWLLLASGADAVARLLGVDAQAEGRPWWLVGAEAARLATLGAAWGGGWVADLPSLAQAWAAAAAVAAAVLAAGAGWKRR